MINMLNNCEHDDEKKFKQNYGNISYPLKNRYNPIIPMNIFQTWNSKKIPLLMANTFYKIKNLNPEFNYYLYDDNDCYNFIKKNFDQDILNAYNSLIPGAYKADLWRYCILYKFGGIYLDIKYEPLNNFKFINLIESEHFVSDINNIDIYNALIVCKPGNTVLLDAINEIVKNVKNKFYGETFLAPTGPKLLSNFLSTNNKIVDLTHKELYNNNNYKLIFLNNIPILKSYKGHIKERDINSKNPHYSVLWNNKYIYK